MSTFEEMKEIPKKYRAHRDKLTSLFRRYEVDSIKSLIDNFRNDSKFNEEWRSIWLGISKEGGGKLSLTTIGVIIGSSLGGVGIAAMGSAIGVPLALILGLGGFISGTTFDSLKMFGARKSISFSVPNELHTKIIEDAAIAKISVSEFVEKIVAQSYVESV